MSKVVIIGAGPMGLYLAYKLTKAGLALRNIAIYDPRAGEYVRPGHINTNIFEILEHELGKKFWSNDKLGHIKDIERILLKEIESFKILIEKKRFIRFNDDPSHKGVIVADALGEHLVECDYVFDCTGSQRTVIHKVNEAVTPKPFSLAPISMKINVSNHFIAYVKMNKNDLARINKSQNDFFKQYYLSATDYTNSIEALRQFGWREFDFPRCYGVDFSKGKVCLYLECPDNLPPKQYEAWVQATINANTNSTDISFSQLGESSKYRHKPRFNSFQVNPMELNRVAYQAADLPLVVAVGDAQIEPNYYLAHGIKDGLIRVNLMLENMEIFYGAIQYFDADEYYSLINVQLSQHKRDIEEHYEERSQNFHEWMIKAVDFYSTAIPKTTNPEQQHRLKASLREVQGRLWFHDAKIALSKLYDRTNKISLTTINSDQLELQLNKINTMLIDALNYLPLTFEEERNQALEGLKEVAVAWKELGTYYVKLKQDELAIEKYNGALQAYSHPLFANLYPLEELVLMSNMVICLKKTNNNKAAISLAKRAIETYPDNPNLLSIKNKIMFNLFNALVVEYNAHLKDKSNKKVQWSHFLELHSDLLNAAMNEERQKLFPRGESYPDDASMDSPLHSSGESGLVISFFNKSGKSPMISANEGKSREHRFM